MTGRDLEVCNELMQEKQDLRLENEKLRAELVECKKKLLKGKNERNAGRKSVLTNDVVTRAGMLKMQGKTYRQIADDLGVSEGTAFNAVKKFSLDFGFKV